MKLFTGTAIVAAVVAVAKKLGKCPFSFTSIKNNIFSPCYIHPFAFTITLEVNAFTKEVIYG